MKRWLVVLALAVTGAAYAASKVTPALAAHLEGVSPTELVRVIVVMEEQMPQEKIMALTEGLTRDERRLVVEQELSLLAGRAQREVLAYLSERAAAGRAADVTSLWIVNAVAARADRETIERVSTLAGVSFVDWEEEVPVELLEDVVDGVQDEIAWGVEKIKAPAVWSAGYKGTGVIVCVCDGGVNYNHVDLKDHMWNNASYPNHGKSFAGGDPNDTMDYDGHGTHVAGTVASDGTAGSQCGVAPEATIMIAKLGAWESSWFEAWQWAITQGADVLTQSWSYKYIYGPLYAQHRQASEKILAAGVIHVNSTGNQGGETSTYPVPFNIAAPANCPPPWLHPNQTLREGKAGTIAVGASSSDDWRASYSGRGPASWDQHRLSTCAPYDDYHYSPGLGLLKPDIMAPGQGIKSCDFANVTGYTSKSGTSMSTPHAAGAAALLFDYLDTLPPAQIQKALELTAARMMPYHTQGKKMNDYGAGRIDVDAALQLLKKSIGIDLKYFRAAGLDDRVRLAWDCESGAYAGFNIYREGGGAASAADAGRRRLNAALITGRTPFSFEDRDVVAAATYKYWLEVIPNTGKAEMFGPASATPGVKLAYGFALEPSYPNPSTAEAHIRFSLPVGVSGDYAITIYDLAGRKVRTVAAAPASPGRHEVTWNLADDAGRKVPPGVYLYWLRASCGSAARRMVVEG